MKNYKMWIGGKWVAAESGKTYKVVNPATEEVIAQVPLGDKSDVAKAYAAAKSAAPIWAGKSLDERARVLYQFADGIKKHVDELVELDVIDHGTPVKVARGLIGGLYQMCEYVAQATRGFMGQVIPAMPGMMFYTQREPRGVVALITPWNVPIAGAIIKISAALGTGNTCILKPASIDSLGTLKLGEILEKIDLPPGAVNIITGPGDTVGEALATYPGIGLVSFTGSCEAGKRIMQMASDSMKRLQMELGGKNPFIVLQDANLNAAVKRAVFTCYWNSGMVCSAPGRFFVHESLYEEFVDKFVAGTKQVVFGNPADEKTDVGPVVSAEHRDKVDSYITLGVQEGAKLAYGGQKPAPPLNKGYYVMPAVFREVTQNMRIAREEIFGPVAVIIKFSSEDQVIDWANDSNFGLAASVWTMNVPKGIKMANRIQAGTVWINEHQKGGIELPWGGYKESGFSKEKSMWGMEEFVQTKVIGINLTE